MLNKNQDFFFISIPYHLESVVFLARSYEEFL